MRKQAACVGQVKSTERPADRINPRWHIKQLSQEPGGPTGLTLELAQQVSPGRP